MKAVVHYFVLVGIPILGVLGLLEVGKGVAAPVSVWGNWQIELRPEVAGNTSCMSFLSWPSAPILTISQSGSHLQLKFKNGEKTALTGTLTDLRIAAAAPGISLEASVDRQVEQNRLSGRITLNDCPSPLLLKAIQQPLVQGRKTGH